MAVKKQICFKISENYLKKIDELIISETFTSQSAFCEAAVIEWFSKKEVRDYLPAEIIAYFNTEHGRDLLGQLFQQQVLEAFKNLKQ